MRHQLEQKAKAPHGTSRRSILWVVLVVVIIGALTGWLLVQVRQKSSQALLFDAITNTADVLDESTQPHRLTVGLVPNSGSEIPGFTIITDGAQKDSVYSGEGSLGLTIGEQKIVVPAEFYSDSEGQWLRFTDIERVITNLESENPAFKFYSGYVRELATGYEDKWIQLSQSQGGPILGCSELLSTLTDEADAYRQHPFVSEITQLDSENIEGVPSEHLQVQIDPTKLQQFAGSTVGAGDEESTKQCVDSIRKSSGVFDVWIDNQNRVFTKITTQISGGKLSTTLVPSKQQGTTLTATQPTEFTTVDDLKKDLEYIIGSF